MRPLLFSQYPTAASHARGHKTGEYVLQIASAVKKAVLTANEGSLRLIFLPAQL